MSIAPERESKMRDSLKEVRDWARDKISYGSEPPWAWYQYMKLIETVDTILDGFATTVRIPRSESPAATTLRLIDSTDRPKPTLPM